MARDVKQITALQATINQLVEQTEFTAQDRESFAIFREALRRGHIRAAERGADGTWRTNKWVKRGILLGFRMGVMVDMSGPSFTFFDKDTYPTRPMSLEDKIRIVPGGTTVR